MTTILFWRPEKSINNNPARQCKKKSKCNIDIYAVLKTGKDNIRRQKSQSQYPSHQLNGNAPSFIRKRESESRQ